MVLASAIRQGKKYKDRKEEKSSLYAVDMTVYEKTLNRIKPLESALFNIQKIYLYKQEQWEIDIKRHLFPMALKNIKYLQVNLMKEARDIYTVNYWTAECLEKLKKA